MTAVSETAATIRLRLATRSYDIRIGPRLIDRAGSEIAPLLARPRVAIITDETVAGIGLQRLNNALRDEGIAASPLVLPPGEATKSWQYLIRTTDWLLDRQVERNDLIIAFGGGVIGDLTGFAASILRRGVRLVQIPTTLLSQVDSSVGGKTGINTNHGKNLVGSFHQPELVLADTTLLDSLPRRELLSGYGEILKCALIGDASFFRWLETHGPAVIDGDPEAGLHAIRRSVGMKAEIVGRDETEVGDRALLNLGHTFSHALEIATGYSARLRHGEGVAIGCMLAFELANTLGDCPHEDMHRLRRHLRRIVMKASISEIPGTIPSAEALIDLMHQDKKAVGGALRFILPRGIGDCRIMGSIPPEMLRGVLARSAASGTMF